MWNLLDSWKERCVHDNEEELLKMDKRIVKVLLGNNSNSMSIKAYDFWTDILTLKKGDLVVCDTVNGMVLGSIVEYTSQAIKVNKWVVDKVDTHAHERRAAYKKKITDIKRQMEARHKKLEGIRLYQLIARHDAEMATLVCKLEQLTGLGDCHG